ncbi:hypothetical protein N8T08_000376 [Aspergillus melleus]|uniref:Uncharacterized protein n=1 Tax=Aspergillus melleus TaxID=138277 RepID=A0ACC3BBM6_9EURO|nr:hypothetical protein N8T08_000376 [Aspergillus melleus]
MKEHELDNVKSDSAGQNEVLCCHFCYLAAAAPTTNGFVLKAKSSSSAVSNGVVIFRANNLLVSQYQGQHGVNFKGGSDTLAIENGDGVYVSADGHLSIGSGTSASQDGFTFSGTTLKSSEGPFYTCEEEMLPRYGNAPNVQAIYVKGDSVNLADNCVELTLNKASA